MFIYYLIQGESNDRHNKVQVSYRKNRDAFETEKVSWEGQKDFWNFITAS